MIGIRKQIYPLRKINLAITCIFSHFAQMKLKYLPSSQAKMQAFRSDNRPDYCPISGVIMTNPAIDHDHHSGMVRGVIDNETNALMGRAENAYKRLSSRIRDNISLPDLLRNMADFLEEPPVKNVLHPVGLKQLVSKFKAGNKDSQLTTLEGLRQMGYLQHDTDILACKNEAERVKLYRKALTSNSL